MLAEVQGWCRVGRGGAGGAGRVQGRYRWCKGGAGYLHRLHLSKRNIRCREVQEVQAHLRTSLLDPPPTRLASVAAILAGVAAGLLATILDWRQLLQATSRPSSLGVDGGKGANAFARRLLAQCHEQIIFKRAAVAPTLAPGSASAILQP